MKETLEQFAKSTTNALDKLSKNVIEIAEGSEKNLGKIYEQIEQLAALVRDITMISKSQADEITTLKEQVALIYETLSNKTRH